MQILNPATDQVVADIYEDTPASVDDKHARAVEAQPRWAATPLADRLAALAAFAAEVARRAPELAATLTAETGKPITQARNELAGLGPRIQFFLERTEATLAPEVVHDEDGMHEEIAHEPLGVIANISAWNYPYFVGSNVFVPALLAGNAVLYKPSEHATLTGLAIAEMLHAAGVPQSVFVPVVGGADVGSALLQHDLDGVFFTGSYRTGRRIAEEVASRLCRVQLELGGKDPVYVTDDAEVAPTAAALADGAFYNAGQSCCSVERIYVHDSVWEPFLDAFVEAVAAFVVGDPTDEATYLGPLARAAQLDVLEAQVADALDKGGRLLLGGHRRPRPGNWFEPTVVADATADMHLMRQESFGPVIGLARVVDDTEAVAAMNDTDFGLTAGVYSTDEARARAILGQVDAGSVYWNCCDRVSPRLPWSGRGHSGMGATLSTYGILTFVQPKAWHLRRP